MRAVACGLMLLLPAAAGAAPPIKVRTITAFAPLEAATAEATLQEAAQFLKQARTRLQAVGWEVQTLRVATPPMSSYLPAVPVEQRLEFLLRLDALADELGVLLSVGPVISDDQYDRARIELAVDLLRRSRVAHASVLIANRAGIQPHAIRAAAEIVRRLGAIPGAEPLGFRFAALAACPPGIPFFPAGYASEAGRTFAFGLQSADAVSTALSRAGPAQTEQAVVAALAPLRELEAVAHELESGGWQFAGIDTSPAPLGDESIAAGVEYLSGVPVGAAGTLEAVARLTRILATLRVRRTGFSGLMLPVLEDERLARRAAEGRLSVQLLLTYSAISGTGLDVIPLPGDTTDEQLERVLRDVAALAVRLGKPLTARLLVVPGKRPGEMTEFDSPRLTNTRVLAVE
jgi:uncharacterized protein (UPF0210 family)